MKFLTDYELQHLEHESLRFKYRELQVVIEGLEACNCAICKVRKQTECSCTLDGVTCGNCQSDAQALEDTQKRVEQSIERDTAKGINGYGD